MCVYDDGFSRGAGSLAAGAQAQIGSVAAGSLFAVLQSAGAGGVGAQVIAVPVAAGMGAVVAGIRTPAAYEWVKSRL